MPTKSQIKETKAEIEKIIEEFSPILHTEKFHFLVQFNPDIEYFDCQMSEPYLHCVIRFNDKVVEQYFDKSYTRFNFEHSVVHEMCHKLTDAFYVKAVSRYTEQEAMEHERERLVDHIAYIAMKVKYGKTA